MCPQANLREAAPQLKFSPPRCAKLTTKIRKSVVTYLFAKSCLLLSLECILETMTESYGSLMCNVLKKGRALPSIAVPQRCEFPPAMPKYSSFSTASSTLDTTPNEAPSSGFEVGVSVVSCVSLPAD